MDKRNIIILTPASFNFHEYMVFTKAFPEASVISLIKNPRPELTAMGVPRGYSIYKCPEGAVFEAEIIKDNMNADLLISMAGSFVCLQQEGHHPAVKTLMHNVYNTGGWICTYCLGILPLLLSGLPLKGKKLSTHPWRTMVKEVLKKGAIYTGNNFEVDPPFITARGQYGINFWLKAVEEHCLKR